MPSATRVCYPRDARSITVQRMPTKRAVHEAELSEDERLARRARRAENARRRTKQQTGKEPHKKKRAADGKARVQVGSAQASIVWDNVSLDDWDDEELMRGQRRNANGRFSR